MRRFINVILIAMQVILLAIPYSGVAFASSSNNTEKIIYQQIGTASWDIWKHSDGTWQATGKPGDAKTHTWEYTIPENKLKGYTLTKIEVSDNPFSSEDEYKAAGGKYDFKGKLMPYRDFIDNVLKYAPDGNNPFSQKINQDLSSGKATVKWSFVLNPLEGMSRRALDLKDPKNRDLVNLPASQLANAAEGWRWYLPVLIKWYGIPKATHDIKVSIVPYKTTWKIAGSSETIKATITVKRKDNIPGNIPVKVTMNGPGGKKIQTLTLAPGAYKQYTYSFVAGPGTYTISAEAWPSDSSWTDAYPPDNKAKVTVTVSKMNLPPKDSPTRTNLGGR